ncbi:MAG TPA: glycosyltransferase family 39 protein [bacterium]|nr:glycosyltransferase family 39 protein [bacterium]
MESASVRNLSRHLPLAAIVALAAAFRIALLIEHYHSPLFTFLRLDELQYEEGALGAMQGELFQHYVPTNAPGYSWFLGALYYVFGHSLMVPRLAQIALGLASIIIAHRVARRLFSEAAGLMAALILALYWPLMIFEQRLLSASLFVFLNLAGLWAAARAAQGESSRPWALAGLIFGAAALVRPEAMLIIIAYIVWLCGRAAREKSWRRMEQALGLTALAFLVVAPVVQVQHGLSGEWMLLQSNGGLNLYLGNNPDSDGTPYARPGGAWDALTAMPARQGALTDAEQDRWFARKAWEFARSEPMDFLKLVLKKSALLASHREVRATIDPEFHRSLFRVLKLPLPGFALVLGLAVPGLLALWPMKKGRQALLIYIGVYAAATVGAVVSSRYRLPFTAGIIILSGAGAARVVEAARALRRGLAGGREAVSKRSLAPLALLALGLAAAYLPVRIGYNAAEEYAYLGDAWMNHKNVARAAESYQEALKLGPSRAQAMRGLARIELGQGGTGAAEQWLRRAVAADPAGAEGHYELGSLWWRQGRKDEAIKELGTAVDCSPQSIMMLYWLAYYERLAGNTEDAKQRLMSALLLRPDFEPARQMLLEMESR